MGRTLRLDDVSCAICMDSLFTKRDDLDEVEPIATPHCGHVFHEKCLLSWFAAQTSSYIAAFHDRNSREPTPTGSEAPVECPTCRTECFLDGETGELAIHRLYLNLGGEDLSSQLASSPGPSSHAPRASTRTDKEREVMGLAKRAKSLGEEFKALSADSTEGDVEGALRRAEGLKEEMASVKAIQGIKNYVGGLNAAINALRSALETHPLIHTLQDTVKETNAKLRTTQQDMRELATITLPAHVQAAVAAERARGETLFKQLEQEMKLVRQALHEEQVARRAIKSASEDRKRNDQRMMEGLKREMAQLKAEKESLQQTLTERSKLIKVYQAKAESRKELKKKNDELQDELKRLRSKLDSNASFAETNQSQLHVGTANSTRRASPHSTPTNPPRSLSPVKNGLDEISPSLYLEREAAKQDQSYGPDESLMIVMPQGSSSLPIHSSPRAGPSRHPTARTISCELDTGKKRPPSSRSKYFTDRPDAILLSPNSEGDLLDLSPRTDMNKVLVHGSSSPPEPIKKRKTNPYPTSRADGERRRLLKPWNSARAPDSRSSREPIRSDGPKHIYDLTNDLSSPQRPALAIKSSGRSNVGVGIRSSAKGGTSLVEKLGITDAHGRPTKGVIGGAKVKRRA